MVTTTSGTFIGKCPNCEFEITVNPKNKSLEVLLDKEFNLLKFIRSLPEFSDTNISIIKHEGKLRIEVERIKEKIIL